MCGTPDYMAPEVIALTGHSTAVDYWSLGVLVYEMLVGYPPFTDEDTMTTFAKIREPEKIVYPEGLSPESVHFIRSLLVVDPSRRLGNIHRETEDIKNHPWLAPIDWMEVARRSGDGPIIPQVQGPSDTQNFKNADTADRLQLTQDVDIPPDVQQMFDSF
jgi:serine/threonine protein kinase